jgi:hypothetical protein
MSPKKDATKSRIFIDDLNKALEKNTKEKQFT